MYDLKGETPNLKLGTDEGERLMETGNEAHTRTRETRLTTHQLTSPRINHQRVAAIPLTFLWLLLFCAGVSAQTLQSGLAPTLPSASAASYYYIAKPGELTMQVNVWGFVKNPGRY